MRTTTRSFDPHLVGGILLALLGGCSATPQAKEGAFLYAPEALKDKAVQTRYFETREEVELLSAAAATLQDLGFHIDECVRELGFLRGHKERSARSRGQEIGRFFALFFAYYMPAVDLHQQFGANLVARPLASDDGVVRQEVRVMFYRIVWKGMSSSAAGAELPGLQRLEMLREPEIYQRFFTKFSQSLFLEAHAL